MAIDGGNQQLVADTVPFARSYQLEALEMALKQNTLVYFETGTGKTLIAIMLLRSYAHLLRKPSPYIAVFLVPTVVLVSQQHDVVKTYTDLKTGQYYGDLGVDFWNEATWNSQMDEYEVLVMTPQILLDALRHKFIRLDQIKVLIFDECHHARGNHPYACIMKEIYHEELKNNSPSLPRVFGMTASPIKAKVSKAHDKETAYMEEISKIEDLMHSKFYTCSSESVLTRYTPFSTPKLKEYHHQDIPHETSKILENNLLKCVEKHELSLRRSNISESAKISAKDKLKKLRSTLMFCLADLGVWLAMKAAEVYSHVEGNIYVWGSTGVTGDRVARAFSRDAVKAFSSLIPSDPQWSIGNDLKANMTAGYVSSKIVCLVETLLEYRELKDLRCIVFVQRIVSAVVICELLNKLLQESTGWKTEYTAGGSSFQHQTREEQRKIVENFRKGTVNIIIATSMLEEGLDVQSCNLVIRFDPSSTMCSFIQSRGRARMQNSDFVIMVERGDNLAIANVNDFLESGPMMRKECLSHADLPCQPLSNEMYGEHLYKVESTGAIVTLNSSVQLLNYYCSRLPSDKYFKPYPRCTIDKELGSCTLYLPSSCPIQNITVSGKNIKSLKQLACLEACKKLHEVCALTDNLVPDIVWEEAEDQNYGSEPYLDEHVKYIPRELVGSHGSKCETRYECYLIELQLNFQYDEKPRNILLAVHERLDNDLENFNFDLNVDRGKVAVNVKDVGYFTLSPDEVAVCQQFQVALFGILLKHDLDKLHNDGLTLFNYLLLPFLSSNDEISVDWKCICAVLYPKRSSLDEHTDRCSSEGDSYRVHTKNGLVCSCMLENALVRTPHNGLIYCTKGFLDGIDGNSCFNPKDGESITYKDYFKKSHGICLQFERQNLLHGKHIFTVQNYLKRCRNPNKKENSKSSCELPPELCSIIMSPIPISTLYSFSLLPSIMHRIESMLLAANLRSVPMLQSNENVVIPTLKVLEAITTKKCQENLHLESLETFGDSFLKYAASQQLFKTYQNRHEGLLSLKRERIICNASLCKLGCDRNITGFIRNEEFDPKTWIIPGTNSGYELSSWKKVYIGATRKIKSKVVADVVEALIGAYLVAGGEKAALSFMSWLGISIDFVDVPYMRTFNVKAEEHINVNYLESLLGYKFHDASLLVEALTHGSYMRPEIPGCYQRLEFLGDAVLDYLMTLHLYNKYDGLSPGLLTDLRSASVNNDCYALSAIRAGLYKHILHLSPDLNRHIGEIVNSNESISIETFGWESEITLPKVLGDVIESIAGAIYIDSGCDKERVFKSMRPLLEPLITLETLRFHPISELNQLCQKMHYHFDKPVVSRENGMAYVTVEVEAQGVVHKASRSARDRKLAEKLACRDVLESLKESMSQQFN
ncbi:hypothetical protein ACS0TY_009230 [Phlomoides rotata]